ncbi:MAG: hypothetical protein JST26_05320 [Bacteroidetes bacterium]|nr:hypothetical protein [Bacteroidota bacterium]
MNKQKLKTAFIIWLSIYPLITLVFYFFGKDLLLIPLPLRTLIITAVLVPVMVFIMVPLITKLMNRLFKW